MDNLTNNIVNAETTGYKKDILVTAPFEEVLLKKLNDPNVEAYGARVLGPLGYGSHIAEAVTDFSQGNIETTNSPTDLAIMGDGFFAIEAAGGERYTRDGTFAVSADGYLSTQDGRYVLGQNGRIYVGTGDFTVRADGTVVNSAGEESRLRLVSFEDTGALRKEGGNLFYIYGEAVPAPSQNSSVLQGAREGSNVDVTEEMVDMIAIYRRYEAGQRIVSMTDESLALAVNLGRVGG
jgi:flagellar basal-body rod protein FlgG